MKMQNHQKQLKKLQFVTFSVPSEHPGGIFLSLCSRESPVSANYKKLQISSHFEKV